MYKELLPNNKKNITENWIRHKRQLTNKWPINTRKDNVLCSKEEIQINIRVLHI